MSRLKKKIAEICIPENFTVKQALKKLDETKKKLLLVVKSSKLLGTLGDGDIRRFILEGGNLFDSIEIVYNINPVVIKKHEYDIKIIKALLRKNFLSLIPIVDGLGRIVDIAVASEIFNEEHLSSEVLKKEIDLSLVIMAGGEGSRLVPFTKILPKPLLPIDDIPMVDIILKEFERQGIKKFYLTLNHKAEMVKSYFSYAEEKRDITFVKEKDFCGTAGSLRLLEDKLDDDFFVSNCDVMVRVSLSDVLDFHRKTKADLTLLSAIQHHKVPYGVVHFTNGGRVSKMIEKPEYSFSVNTGVYLLNKRVLKYIPKNKYFDMTDLIEKLISKDKIVSTYPVNESDYVDFSEFEKIYGHQLIRASNSVFKSNRKYKK